MSDNEEMTDAELALAKAEATRRIDDAVDDIFDQLGIKTRRERLLTLAGHLTARCYEWGVDGEEVKLYDGLVAEARSRMVWAISQVDGDKPCGCSKCREARKAQRQVMN